MTEPIRLVVVDDHRMFSEALTLLFSRQPGIRLVASAFGAEEGIELCRADPPDVVLMDIDLPGMDGIEATRRIREACPHTKVIVLTAYQSPGLVASALAAGACGYVPKTRAVDELLDVVRRAAAGEIVMPARDLPLVLDQLRNGQVAAPVAELALRRLTSRESEILRALATGDTVTSIARNLGISPLTVQSHVKSILAKLGVHTKIEAVTLAWRHGLAVTSRTA